MRSVSVCLDVEAVKAGTLTHILRPAVTGGKWRVGGHLWVREKWKIVGWDDQGFPFIGYLDGTEKYFSRVPTDLWAEKFLTIWQDLSVPSNAPRYGEKNWRPAVTMPKWLSRCTVQITEIEKVVNPEEQTTSLSWLDVNQLSIHFKELKDV